MTLSAADLADRLARDAETVCRHYLSNGRREGRYWLVGDARNTPGRSLFVRLTAAPARRGLAGKWSDAATGEHGDMLDLIAAREGLTTLRATLDEARRFLLLPRPDPGDGAQVAAPAGSPQAAQRLFAMSKPLRGTIAEAYLRARGITDLADSTALRFHPFCWYRPSETDAPATADAWPALIAAVTAGDGTITGVQRSWLDPSGTAKAPVVSPRKALGMLLGNGVRFGRAGARGDWVEDPVGGYFSDYDILVVVNDERLTDVVEYWAKADDNFLRAVTIDHTIGAPVNFIVHTLQDVNEQLQRGRLFFIDIIEHGIALYEAEDFAFDQPRPLTPEAALDEARANFDMWFPKGQSALKGARFFTAENENNDAAFLLHQAAERFYHCLLLVLTLYTPKSHKLNFLRSQAEAQASELIEVWPRNTKFGQRCFELLRQAYVNARYSKHYKITGEELEWIAERVQMLADTVERLCKDRLTPA